MTETEKLIHSPETVAAIVRQSRAIHPRWDAALHLSYLDQEGIERGDLIHFPVSGARETVEKTVTAWIDGGLLA